MLNAPVGSKLVTVAPSLASIGCLVASLCRWLVDSCCKAEAEVRQAIVQLDFHQATEKKFAEAKVVAGPKLVKVVAGLLSAKLLLSGAEAAAGKDPDSTSKLVQDALFEAYAAPLLAFGKLLLFPFAFVSCRLGLVSFPFSFVRLSLTFAFAFSFARLAFLFLFVVWVAKLLSFSFALSFVRLVVSPSFVPHTVQAGFTLHVSIVEVFLEQAVKITKATATVKLHKHVVSDLALQTIHHRCKLDEVWKVLSRKLLIPHGLLLPSVVLL